MWQICNVKFLGLWLASLHICFTYCMADKPCNMFVDKVLSHMSAAKDLSSEPYEIPDSQKSFGIYELDFGHIYGLGTLHRVDDVEVIKGDPNYLKINLAAGEMKINSSVRKKRLSFGRYGNVDANIPLLEMELEVVPESDGSNPVIQNFKVVEAKGLKVKVSGAGFLKALAYNAFLSAFGRFFVKSVKSTVEDKISSFLAEKAAELTVPRACLNDVWY